MAPSQGHGISETASMNLKNAFETPFLAEKPRQS
jgi:hypothetical protein